MSDYELYPRVWKLLPDSLDNDDCETVFEAKLMAMTPEEWGAEVRANHRKQSQILNRARAVAPHAPVADVAVDRTKTTQMTEGEAT